MNLPAGTTSTASPRSLARPLDLARVFTPPGGLGVVPLIEPDEVGMKLPESSAAAARRARVTVHGKLFEQAGQRLKLRGVTYGPFASNATGEPLPEPSAVAADFGLMRAAGINSVRIYHPPPAWFLDLALENGLLAMMEIPCPKHLGFLESAATQREARARVSAAVQATPGHPAVLGCCIGNEIGADLVRWYGARRIERFLSDLADAAHQADPDTLVTYASYPPTEYLQPPGLDFTTLNVYLHDRATFRRYLMRLANLSLERPLLLGEIGMDTLRHGEEAQANFLRGHIREATLAGLAGSFVFSWTDDWFTNGWQIEDWAFGLTRRDRAPKQSYHAIAGVFGDSPAALLEATPRVSVVVCSYNGGRTLEQCLRSLEALAYPNLEVILVDDGSTDNTPEIAARHPGVRYLRQNNQGLSVARNVGLQAATGELVAYTDSDCFADADWLALLVHQLQASGATAVGGPNLTPEDGWLAGCVACAPGQPIHVLESDEIAEHIPGCNMAFRRAALLAIGGFDPIFRKAGDDVDLCWRLQEAGYKITFAPGAFVWHHRRQGPRAYFKQQAGYGEAEAMLARKHPERFSILGGGIWRGVMYGDALAGLRLGRAHIYGGVFGQGLFQTLYQPRVAHWAMLPATLEWQATAALFTLLALDLPTLGFAVLMWAFSGVVTILQAAQARPAPRHDGLAARCVVATLCWLQPLVRSGQRYRTRFAPPPVKSPVNGAGPAWPGPLTCYITMTGVDRAVLLTRAAEELRRRGHSPRLDTGWSRWDIEVPCTYGVRLQLRTVQEFYGGNSAQIAVAFRRRRSVAFDAVAVLALVVVALGVRAHLWQSRPTEVFCYGVAVLLGSALTWLWQRGKASAARATAILDETAKSLGMTPFQPEKEPCKAAS